MPGSNTNDAIIESITCPITGDIMKDPVQGTDGQTYERSAILHALSIKSESPITREPMRATDLKVNASIRFLCDKYHAGEFGTDNRVKTPPKISTDVIKLDHTIYKNTEEEIMLTFNVNKSSMPTELENGHLSQDVVLVIDHSGSTCSAVQAKDDSGNNLENGMSILDIVKHSASTVAKTLDSNSRLAIIVFDDKINVIFNLTLMSEINCTRAITEISKIEPCGQTNIWHAVEKAISILGSRDDKSRNGAIMMLTDGMPNIRPARGEVETLKRLRKSLNFTSPIYTFGFGYSLERGLLYNMAKYGNGSNGHIPDGGMIATVFCHSIATILSTVVVNLQLHIAYNETIDYEKYPPLMGDFAHTVDDENPFNVCVDLGTVQLGQMRHIILNTSHLRENCSYYYSYKIGGNSYSSDIVTNVRDLNVSINNTLVNSNIGRCKVIESIRNIIKNKKSGNDNIAMTFFNQLVRYYEDSGMTDPLSKGIIKNLIGMEVGEGQIKIAVTNDDYFWRWGEFYLDQLSRSLNQEIKPNFRDTACMFGGDVFETLVDKASDIFDSLPPPEPSLIKRQLYRSANSGAGYIAPTRAATLASYNSASVSTPCFHGSSLVHLANGTHVKVEQLKRGDKVITLSDPYNVNGGTKEATVVCILKTLMHGTAGLVTLGNGLKITPWHPVLIDSEWKFPIDIGHVVTEQCDAVYSILLDNGHTCNINNVWCIGLGHDYKEGIIKHNYFGTSAIVNDMQSLPGWKSGLIILDSRYSIVRDPDTTLIISICGKGKQPMYKYKHMIENGIPNLNRLDVN